MKKQFIFALTLSALVIVSACKKKDKDDDNNNPPEDPKTVVQRNSNSAHQDVVDLTQSQGAKAGASLSKRLNDDDSPISRIGGKGATARAYKKKAQLFRTTFLPSAVASNLRTTGDQVAANAGTYTWNNTSKSWDVTASPSDKVIVKFPSDTTNMTNNDGVLTLYKYTDTDVNGDTLPTNIVADLYVGSSKYISVDFSASYSADGFPQTLNYTVYAKPFTNTTAFSDKGTSITVSSSLNKDGEPTAIFGVGETVTFATSAKDSVLTFAGYVQYREIKVKGTVNVAEIDNASTQNSTVFNQYFDMDLVKSSDDSKLADFEFFEDTASGETDVRLKFTDGTTELASVYFDPIINEISDFANNAQ